MNIQRCVYLSAKELSNYYTSRPPPSSYNNNVQEGLTNHISAFTNFFDFISIVWYLISQQPETFTRRKKHHFTSLDESFLRAFAAITSPFPDHEAVSHPLLSAGPGPQSSPPVLCIEASSKSQTLIFFFFSPHFLTASEHIHTTIIPKAIKNFSF